MSFRKEKKFRLSYGDMLLLKEDLLASGMKALYPPRNINSCYFDTKDFRLYSESEEGVLPRKKVRIRWYNQSDNFTKEEKISSVEGRFKTTKALDAGHTLDDIKNMQLIDQIYGVLVPALIVSYQREYYSLNQLRVTFDKRISYVDLRHMSNPEYQDGECVMEIKTPISCDDDYIERIVSHSTSRFSKYSRGLLASDGAL